MTDVTLRFARAVIVCVTACACVEAQGGGGGGGLDPDPAFGQELLGRVPLAFVPNLGQWEHPARYVARLGLVTAFLEDSGFTISLSEKPSLAEARERTLGLPHAMHTVPEQPVRGRAVRMRFVGAGAAELVPEGQLSGHHNYFLGNDPGRWRTDVPLFAAVRYRGLYPDVEVRTYAKDGYFEYDLVLQPDAKLEPVEIAVEGVERMCIDAQGALVLETGLGPVRMAAPLTWEEGPSGERSLVTCRYVLRGEDRFGFEVTGRRPGWVLIVDPGLVWSTYLGGTGYDLAYALALDAQGAVTVAGYTQSADFPTTPGAFDTSHNGGLDVFITRLSPTGSSLVYSTFLGGTGSDGDYDLALAVDAQGAATVAGQTESPNFPTTPGAFDTSYNGSSQFPTDAFVTRLSATGSSLIYSTFLGGTSHDAALALALDAQGAATVAGQTYSAGFPTTPGAFDTSYNGGGDAFVTQLSPTGSSLVYSTFLGGTSHDAAGRLALDAQGAATVAGYTNSTDFPTTPGAFDTSYNGGGDAFITRLTSTGASLAYSTFLGGTSGDSANALALDAQGAAILAGETNSTNFPTTPGAFDTSFNGGGPGNLDAFITRLSPTGSSLVYSTFLGGTGDDRAKALALDAQGVATVAGGTSSINFPTTPGAFDTSYNGGGGDAFITRLSPTGSSLAYSTFLGGTSGAGAWALALDAQGAATVMGWTSSADFPTTPGALDPSYNGGPGDVFISRLVLLPAAISVGSGCGGAGMPVFGCTPPHIGQNVFLTLSNGTPNASGFVYGSGVPAAPYPLGSGCFVQVDLASAISLLPVATNGGGAWWMGVLIPPNPSLVGIEAALQIAVFGTAGPLGFDLSNGLIVTIGY